jgi:ADP-ribose pyrophosphatase
MDMTIKVDQGNTYNIRVAAVCSYNDCYAVDDSNKGYVVHVGGRLKYNETIHEAIKREINEELGIIVDPSFVGVYESFFTYENINIHEHLFLFAVDISDCNLSNMEHYIKLIKKTDINNYLVYPENWEKVVEENDMISINTRIEKQMYQDRDIAFTIGKKDGNDQEYHFRVSALIRNDDKVLIDESASHLQHLIPIGGRLHFGETFNEGLNREIQEELNCTIKSSVFRGIGEDFFIFRNNKQIHFISALFEVELNEELYTAGDGTVPVWMDISELNPSNTKMLSFVKLLKEKEIMHATSR